VRIYDSYEARVRAGNLSRSLELDVTTISLPALLRYEDKNSMFHSLEARVPFLDQLLFEHVASLPLSHKLRNGITKYVFKLAMKDILPENVLGRKNKIGFEVPEKRWIANDLRDRLRSFFEGTLVAKNYYDLNAFRNLLEKSELSEDECRRVWRTINLEVWYQEFLANRR
jgi:asparagine synthase (glutamine-hydrolysing)